MNRVLIVDDKEENRYYLQALLTAHGWSVESARHGAEALVLARLNPPDLVISDLLMPVMDGYMLLRHWKADRRLRRAPFVVYTATYTEAEDEQLALKMGADAFILKPSEPDAFLARIQSLREPVLPPEPGAPPADEAATLKAYSETLIRKLEDKRLELEQANAALREDITRRQRMEAELRDSEERFRATFEHAAVGMAHVGPRGEFIRVNDKLCLMTGYDREELSQSNVFALSRPEDERETRLALQALLDGIHSMYSAEKQYRRKDGDALWVSLVTTLLRAADGEPRYFISVIVDITERKLLEEQFLRIQRLESVGTLASGIAHDLSNLFAPILMSVPLLREKCRDPSDHKMLEIVEWNVQRGADLVRQVLSFARGVEPGKGRLNCQRLAREIGSIVGTTFPKNIRFRAEVAPDLWPIEGNDTQINQVILNLCLNARDAMPNGGSLALRIYPREVDEQFAAMHGVVPAGQYVVLEVTDTGTGIAPGIIKKIFDPFFTTKESGKGTGLGLSTVQAIVRAHAGGVAVHSVVGHGTRFQIYLPSHRRPETTIGASGDAVAAPRGRGELVLIVDDEASILTITRHTLERFGYRTLTAEDGAHAIGLYAQAASDISVVLTDIMMPVMDGRTLITALKRINPVVQVIASSGWEERKSVETMADIGLRHILTKPYTVEALLQTVARAVADAHAPGSQPQNE
jgi:PAS domain S-box-containing protein